MKHQEKLRIYRALLGAGESLRVARSPKSAGPLRHDEIERASIHTDGLPAAGVGQTADQVIPSL